MKTVLRKIHSGLFFAGPDQWTTDPTAALDFKLIDRALAFVERWHLKDVEIAFCFKDRHCVTGVPRERMALSYLEN
jgi:hypothetical protein